MAYPDAAEQLVIVLAKDQFIDALPDEDTWLIIGQSQPTRLRQALETAMELESNFESTVFLKMCTLLGITKTKTTPLHPQSDGMMEWFNHTLEAQLSVFVEDHQQDWDAHPPLLLIAYRTAYAGLRPEFTY